MSDGWDNWEPGDPRAAALIQPESLRVVLGGLGFDTACLDLERIASVVSEALAAGTSADKGIRAIVEDRKTAERIAHSAYAWAQAQSSRSSYADSASGKWGWCSEEDACEACRAASDGSPYKSGEGPVFPACQECRCYVVPVIEIDGVELGMQ